VPGGSPETTVGTSILFRKETIRAGSIERGVRVRSAGGCEESEAYTTATTWLVRQHSKLTGGRGIEECLLDECGNVSLPWAWQAAMRS